MLQRIDTLSKYPNEARTPATTFSNCFEVVLGRQLGIALVLLTLIIGTTISAQDQTQHSYIRNDSPETVERAVHAGLEALWASDDHKELLQAFPDARGAVDFEIVLKRKGIVESVRKKESTIDDHKFMNELQHLIFETKYNFKLQKGNRHKMNYTYNNL